MKTRSRRPHLALLLGLVGLASATGAEPRRRPGAPVIPQPVPVAPPPNQFAPPPPVGPAPGQFAPPPGVFPAVPPAPSGMCTAMLTVRQTVAARGCTIDERVTRAPGVLSYPCAGGPATANFGGSVFQGSVQNGAVTLSIRTAFHFTDGCDWQSVQNITGALGAGALDYVYNEGPLPGQSGCAGACQASGTVLVR